MAVRVFQGTAVGFPTGNAPRGASWEETEWIYWATGELEIHSRSFGLTFTPEGSRGTAKPLGVITNAWIMDNGKNDGMGAFVVTTSDPVHSMVRLDFSSLTDEDAFADLCNRLPGRRASNVPNDDSASRRSSFGGAGRKSSVTGPGCVGAGPVVESAIPECFRSLARQKFPGQLPIIVSGAELYGPEQNGEEGNEVLLGRGAVFLVDPANNPSRVGSYELFFFDEGVSAPMLRLEIGPRLRLEPSREPVGRFSLDGASLGGRASIAARRRSSMPGASGMPTSFDLYVPRGCMFGLVFDREDDAAGFARDFTVRQRLMHVSLQTSRGWRTVDEFRDELQVMRRHGFVATVRRYFFNFLIITFTGWVLYVLMLYNNDDRQFLDVAGVDSPIKDVVSRAAQDFVNAVAVLFGVVASMGMGACSMISRCLPMDEAQRCAEMWEPENPWSGRDVHGCLRAAISGVMR
mmetsp:Transcript_127797/g.367916  ORF Transcript_127797/g.367916 Transcript_127797/m.367916 type:complete len:462 (-) Transcript_127797:61-1446(-)